MANMIIINIITIIYWFNLELFFIYVVIILFLFYFCCCDYCENKETLLMDVEIPEIYNILVDIRNENKIKSYSSLKRAPGKTGIPAMLFPRLSFFYRLWNIEQIESNKSWLEKTNGCNLIQPLAFCFDYWPSVSVSICFTFLLVFIERFTIFF